MSRTQRKQLDDHPLVICFDILQQMGKPGECVWKNGEKIVDVKARVTYLKRAILWLRAKLKESNRIPYRELPVDFRTFVESDQLMKKRGVLWPRVIECGAEINSGKYVEAVLTGGIGVAKCLGAGTPVLMFDGSVRNVEDVVIGDLLMGPDSKPRRIKSLASGQEEMFRVHQKGGDDYVVNKSHVLSLRYTTSGRYGSGEMRNLTVEEFLALPTKHQSELKGWKPDAVDFGGPAVRDPYLLGLWLGDGHSHGAMFTSMDPEIVGYLGAVAKRYGLLLSDSEDKRGNQAKRYSICQYNWKRDRNPVLDWLIQIGVRGNKHVPEAYLTAPIADRLALLAGLMDTDGSLTPTGCFVISQRRKALADALVFLARSCGFRATQRTETIKGVAYYRSFISGDTDRIPTRIARKKAAPRRQVKNINRWGVSVEPLGVGQYYGFELEGSDRLFLLGDFTVTHNTTLAVYTMAYQLYILACLRDPHALFDLDPSSEILMVFQSINKNLAKDVDYKRFRDMVDGSPYFNKVFPFDRGRESDMRFPRNIIVKPVAGQDTAAIGQNVIGGIIDECLVAGTQIETPRGTVQIETLQPGDFVLAARRDGCLVWDEVTAVSQTGVRPVFKIDIDTGESIVGTANHPIATPHGWTDLSALSPGGFVYIAGAKGPRSLHGMASAFVKPTPPHAFRRDGSEDTSDKIDEATGDRSELCAAPAHAAFPSRENNIEQGEVRTRAGLGASEQFNGRNARGAVEVECGAMGKFTELGAASNDAQGRSSARRFGTQGLEAQRGHKGAAVGSAHCLYAERRLPWEGQPLYQSQDDPRYGMASFVVGASLRVRTGQEPQRVVLRLRKGSDHLSVGRRGENHAARFSRDVHERREMYGRGETAIRGENAGFEDCRDEGGRPEQWLGLSTANRARVVGISAAGNAPVYNLTTRRTHTYVANGVIVHNCNFMAVVENSKTTRGDTYDQAAANYTSIARRRESRFMQMGTLPGMLCLVSSRNYPGGLTDRKEAEARSNPHIYVYDKRIWELRPDRFSGEKFRVFTGDETRKPRILTDHDIVPEEDERLVMAIPVEYRRTFDNDLLAALRDVAGVSTMALHPFMLNTEAVVKCFGTVQSIASREDCDFKSTRIELYPKRIMNPNEPRFAHLDLALTKDSAGVVIGHVPGFKHMNRGDYMETLPIVQLDMILEVKPPRGGEIEFENIRALLYALRDKLLLPIKWVSFDQYQSRDSMQIMHQNGFIVGYQSMDIDTEAYDVTKQAFYDDRIRAPAHAKAQKEMITLEMDTKKNKIDHPPQGSKDVSDAMAGVVFGLTMRREIWLRHQIPLQRIPASLSAKAQTKGNITEKERRGETDDKERRPGESHMEFIRRQRGVDPGARNEE